MKIKQTVACIPLALTLFCQPSIVAAADKVSLKVYVTGSVPDSDEKVNIKGASVSVESGLFRGERKTSGSGKASFKPPVGKITVVITGNGTPENWATGSCTFTTFAKKAEVYVTLDRDNVTRDCVTLPPPEPGASGGESDAEADIDGTASNEPPPDESVS